MTAREAAVQALCEVEEGKNVKDALASIFETNELKDEDRQLANELAFGTLRHREEIDQIIRETLTGDFFSLDLTIKNVLRIAVYQYLFFDRIPIYAIVNEAVNFGRTIKEKGLINAVIICMAGASLEDSVPKKTGGSSLPPVSKTRNEGYPTPRGHTMGRAMSPVSRGQAHWGRQWAGGDAASWICRSG